MAATPNRPQLVAVDANVLFDLAGGVDDVIDAPSVVCQSFDIVAPLVATPREIVRRFFR